MATTRKENEGAIEAFNQAQVRLGLPVILTRNCGQIREAALTQIQKDFDAAIDRMKKKSKACMDLAQETFDRDWEATGCVIIPGVEGDIGGDTVCEQELQRLSNLLYTDQTKCIDQARDERAAAAKDRSDRSLQVSLDYAMCCINNPGSCNADAGTPQM